MEIKEVPIESLYVNRAEAPSRYTDAALKELRDAIEARGALLYPILVDEDMIILDGHRRWLCCKALGYQKIPVCILARAEATDVFAEVNRTTRRTSALEWLHGYLEGARVGSLSTRSDIRSLEQLMGHDYLAAMYQAGLSPSGWDSASYVATYLGVDKEEDRDSMRRIVDWVIMGRRQAVVKAAIRGGVSPRRLWAAILDDTDLRMRWD